MVVAEVGLAIVIRTTRASWGTVYGGTSQVAQAQVRAAGIPS